MELTITKLKEKMTQTKYGDKKKYYFTAPEMPQITVFDAYAGQWNSNWKEGSRLELKEDQIKKREYNGLEYASISAPPEARQGGFQQIQDKIEEHSFAIRLLENAVTELQKVCKIDLGSPIEKEMTYTPISDEKPDTGANRGQYRAPVAQDEIDVSKIPF